MGMGMGNLFCPLISLPVFSCRIRGPYFCNWPATMNSFAKGRLLIESIRSCPCTDEIVGVV